MNETASFITRLLEDRPGEPRRGRAARFFFMLTFITDMLMIFFGLGASVLLREYARIHGYARGPDPGFMYSNFPLALCYTCGALFVAFKYMDIYRERRFLTGNREVGGVVKSIFAFTMVNAVLAYLMPTRILFSRLTLALSLVLCSFFVVLGRTLIHRFRFALRTRGLDTSIALIIGTGPVAMELAAELLNTAEHGYRLTGFIGEEKGASGIPGLRVLGQYDELERVVGRLHIDEVFICEPDWDAKRIMEMFKQLQPMQVKIRLASRLFDIVIERVGVPVDAIGEVPILDFSCHESGGWRKSFKRLIDITVALVILLLLSPLWIAVSIAIMLESGRPILFRQMRLGEGEKPFDCLKFRSMRQDAEAMREELEQNNEVAGPMFKMSNDPRVTRVGKFIRKYSLDEFPQLWNILIGEMSLVGPRPPLPSEVEQYDEWHKQRLQGPMGLSGLWQVSGRNQLNFEDMVLLDIYYLQNRSLFLDYRVLVRTLFTVLLGQGK